MLIIINQDLKLLLCNNIVEEKILFFIKIILNQIVCFYRILKKIYFFCSLEKFRFESHRHNEYPFALTLYVNGLIDCRISVCCEYKHKLAIPIGGKKGSFAILNVQGGKPCQTFVEQISFKKKGFISFLK